MGFAIEQKWSIKNRRFLPNKWTIRSLKSKKIVHTTSSYNSARKWVIFKGVKKL